MKRLRLFFAILLLCLLLPMWRFMDMMVFFYPHDVIYSATLFIVSLLFIGIPLILIKPQIKRLYILLGFLQLALLSWYSGTLSIMATNTPEFNHCGQITYTGMFYPLRSIMTYAHQDDLEIRNQLCWLRKMIVRLPSSFESDIEYETVKKLVDNKLLLPSFKFRVSLPMIAFLQGYMLAKLEMNNNPIKHIQSGKVFLDSIQLWRSQYSFEIQEREYSWWNWPHSAYVSFEYGLVERNWEKIIDGIAAESN